MEDGLYLRQNVDEIVGPKHYASLGDKLLVTSIFYTIQGEGPFAGCPAVFVRLAGCNRGDKTLYGCQFCDTDFTFKKGRAMTVDEIIGEVEQVRAPPAVRGSIESEQFLVVITGGEPMMQNNVWNLSKEMVDRGIRVQIESNGDRLAPGFVTDPLHELVLVVSPKVQAKLWGYGHFRPEVLERATCLKFLVDSRQDSPYHLIPPEFRHDRRLRTKVIVSPLTIYKRAVAPDEVPSFWAEGLLDQEATKANAMHAAQMAMHFGLRVSLQTHLFLAMP